MLEWLKRVDCKSISFAYTGSNPVFPKLVSSDLCYQWGKSILYETFFRVFSKKMGFYFK